MYKTILASVAALAVAGLAGAAVAACPTTVQPTNTSNNDPHQIDAQTYCVDVNIEVDEEVSMWANEADIALVMSGADGNNTAFDYSSLSVINNVDAKIDALVEGTLPAPIIPGGGIFFHIFNNQPATMVGPTGVFSTNGYGNANARTWTDTTLGTSQELFASVGGVHTSIGTLPITYAATSPGELPLPQTYDLEVTYTISPNGP